MLCGLGRQLRKCGIDCMILDGPIKTQSYEEVDTVLKEIRDSRRIVLSQGSNVQWFEDQLPPASVYRVKSAAAGAQLEELLCHFDIAIRETDVFSRCQVCNSNLFDKVCQDSMLVLKGLCREVGPNDNLLTTGNGGAASLSEVPGSSVGQRNWVLTDNPHVATDGLTHLGVSIDVGKVPDEILRKVDVFFACASCGKVYWDGSHLSRAVERCKAQGTLRGEYVSSEAEKDA